MWESNELESSAGAEPGGHEHTGAPAEPPGQWADEPDQDDEQTAGGQAWSPEAIAARLRAQRRWREIDPGPRMPSLVLSEEEASALLPPVLRTPDEVEPEPAALVLLSPVEPEPVAAEPLAVERLPEPEPVAVESQPEPVAVEPLPEPERVAAESQPEPVAAEYQPEPVTWAPPAPVAWRPSVPAPWQPSAAVEPAAPAAAPARPEPLPLAAWTGPVLRGMATPRVFSALASAAGTPSPNGGTRIPSAEPASGAVALASAPVAEAGPALPPAAEPAPEPAAVALLAPVEPAPAPAQPEPETPAAATRAVAPWLPAPAPGAPATATAFGPPGRRRTPAMVVLLSVITLGFYALWWHHRVNREMAEFDPRMSVDPGRSTWAVAFPLAVGWTVAALAGTRYILALTGTPTADLPISAGQSLFLALAPLAVPYLVLLLPFSAIAVVMTHERARVLEDRVGIPSELQLHPVDALAWLTVPIAGGLVGMAQMQQHLNEVWRRVGS